MRCLNKSLLLFLLILPIVIVQSVFSAEPLWTELQPLGNVDAPWESVASTPDGEVILVGGSSGRFLYSRDAGSTWRDPFIENSNEYFRSVKVSSDGQKLAVSGFRVYVSSNGGTTWTDSLANGDQTNLWGSMDMSVDGRVIVAGIENGRLFRSTNGGASWSETQPMGNANGNWQTLALNTTGDIVIAANYNGRMYRSTNRGSTWTEIQPSGNMDSGWNTVSMDGSGKRIIAGQDGGMIFLSTDYGNTWNEIQPLGDTENDWRGSGFSMDGSKMLISSSVGTSDKGRVFYSSNSGQSFEEVRPAGDVERDWFGVGISANGHVQFALATGGRMYMRRYSVVSSPELVKDREPWDCGVEKPFATELFQINTTKNSATIYFSPISNTNQFVISYSTNPSAEEHGAQVDLAREGVQNYTISMLQPNTDYYFKVRGQHGCRPGEWSEVLKARTSEGNFESIFYLHR